MGYSVYVANIITATSSECSTNPFATSPWVSPQPLPKKVL
jgi:hypothetical protein